LLGCTAGRTTMNGEGLQHEDGHSHLLASVIPSLRAYDPAFAYEMAILVEAGIEDMYGPNGQDNLWYITLYNENYPMPALAPEDAERVREGVVRGMYRFAGPAHVAPGTLGDETPPRSATLFFSGPSWHAAMRARDLLADDWNVSADAWSVTSYKSLREDALSVERWNRLHPGSGPRQPLISRELAGSPGPIVAVSDYLKAVPDQVARFVPVPFSSLGTDGFGRSDTRSALRRHFEVDAEHIVVAVLAALAAAGEAKAEEVAAAIAAYGIDPEAIDPRNA
jgi:pyruvate dehydrogenase E1 component